LCFVFYVSTMFLKEICQIPNLVSLVRIFLIPVIGYYLRRQDEQAVWLALFCVVLAGITDGLDGFLARRLKKVSRLGILLDPVADKIFAGALVVLLIFYRDFPIWLAVLIISRDLLILLGGALIVKKKDVAIPSNLTGKYAFTSIAILLACHIVRFDFGIDLMTYLTVILLLASIVNYIRVFVIVSGGQAIPVFKDRRIYKFGRTVFSSIFLIIFLYRFYIFVTG